MRRHWVISRPKRKLILVPDLLGIFSSVAGGQNWQGNRSLQIEFETALANAQWKAQNISRDGSGGRTYATLLRMLGLWYEDEEKGAQLTIAGQEILEGYSPIKIIAKQLLDFQYPSPYSLNRNVNISNEFKLWPFRFIIKLLLETDLEEISQEEIAYCLVPFAKTMRDIESCKTRILEFRDRPEYSIEQALATSKATQDNLLNIGNTAVNMFEYTGFFIEQPDIRSLSLRLDCSDSIKKILASLRTSLIQNPEDEVTFQMRYGTGLNTTKDYSRSTRTTMDVNPTERKIITEFYIIAANEPLYSITDHLIEKMQNVTGAAPTLIRNVLNKLEIKHSASQFSTTYLQLSRGGKNTATDFERKTNSFFRRGFNLDSEWVGNIARHPDIIIYVDKLNMKHGIIDTKAYSEYNLPLDHKNKMAYTYIPSFLSYSYEGEIYDLAFFGYVAGGFSSTISRSFSELVSMTNVPGHYISADNLIKLQGIHLDKPLKMTELINIFSINREVLPDEIRR